MCGLGVQRRRHVAGHAGDVHAGASGGHDLPELLQDDGSAVEVDGQHRLGRCLHRGDAGGADDLDDVAETGSGLSQDPNRLGVGHIDPLGADGVAGVLQRGLRVLQIGLAEVGEQHVLARAGAAGDGLPDAAGADDDQDVLTHELCSSS